MQIALEDYWWTGEMRIQVTSGIWLSLAARTGQRAPLRLALDGGTGWNRSDATIVGTADGGGFFLRLFGADATEVPTRLARAHRIEVEADGRILGVYELGEVAEAMEMLRACEALMRAADHSDPFARRNR